MICISRVVLKIYKIVSRGIYTYKNVIEKNKGRLWQEISQYSTG